MAEKSEETQQQGAKRGRMWILILGLVVLVCADLTFRAITFFRAPKSAEASKGAGSAPAQKNMNPEVKATLPLEPFLVNLADSEDVRFVKATFQLGLAEESEELSSNRAALAAMRDSIISLLGSKTAQEILTPEGKEKLRDEIRSRANTILPKVKVSEVYIVDFVVQL